MKTRWLCAVALCLSAAGLSAQTLRALPYSDPAYAFLEKAYALGWVRYLPQIRPYTEVQVATLLDQVEDHLAASGGATPLVERQILELRRRLSRTQRGEGDGAGRGGRFHVLSTRWGEGNRASLDFPATAGANTRLNHLSDSYLSLAPSIAAQVSLSDLLYLSMDAVWGTSLVTYAVPPFRKFSAPQRADYAVWHFLLSRGVSGFAHVDQLQALHQPGETDLFLWANTTSQNALNLGIGTFSFGRQSLSWGPSPLANLALSATSKPYDYLMLDVPLGPRGTFVWMTGFLQDFYGTGMKDYVNKLINIQRAEYQFFDWLLFSFYEAIIYSYRFELSYLNPFGIYAVSEVQHGDYDNKLAGFDLVARLGGGRLPGFKAYLSFYADDWDFGHALDFSYYHNEWAGILGVEAFELLPGLSAQLEYIRLSHWMYTHRGDLSGGPNDFNRYVHFDTHLGHFLNPNSDMIYLKLGYELREDLTVGTSFWVTRNGGGGIAGYDRGDIYTPPDWSLERTLPGWPENSFLDGVVETNVDWTLFAGFRIPRYGVSLEASYSLEYTQNVGKVSGAQRWDHILSLTARWQGY